MFVDVLIGIHLTLLVIIYLRVLGRTDLFPQARLAWFVVLLLIPYVGVVIYWMFGEIHLGSNFTSQHSLNMQKLHMRNPEVLGSIAENRKNQQPNMRQNISEDIPNLTYKYHTNHNQINECTTANASIDHKLKPVTQRFATNTQIDKLDLISNYSAAIKLGGAITGYYATYGNCAQLMASANDTTQRMIADFDAATEQIHVMYYIWLLDHTGYKTAQALIRAAKRGVACRAMVDGMGSRSLIKSKLWQQMIDAGVQVSVALPIKNIIKVVLFSRIDLRNHRKITVIDGKVCYVGSRNCADPEFVIKPKYAPWVDIMVRFEGPIVAQNQMLFASDWLMKNPNTPLDCFKYDLRAFNHGFAAQVFKDGPTQRSGSTPQFLNALFTQAKTSIIISTPYFVPDTTLINVLCATAIRGVDVTMIFPKKNDSLIVAATSRSYYLQLLEAGIKIYEYKLGLLHSKTITIDGEVSMIGSTNLDLRSFDLNYENNVVCYDQLITEQIANRQHDYIADSMQVTRHAVQQWSIYYRIWNNIVATMGPVL